MITPRLITRTRLASAAITALSILAFGASSAKADLVSDLTRDLIQSGVPSPNVSVGSAEGIEMDLPSGTTAPMMRVTYSAPVGQQLQGILPPPDGQGPLFTTTTPHLLLWDLAILEAAKHALQGGADLAGIAVTANLDGEPIATDPDLIMAMPEPPLPQPPTSMSTSEVAQQAKASLPAWAQTADVEVTEDAASERVVTVSLSLPWRLFMLIDVRAISDDFAAKQVELNQQGASIGREIVKITDTQSGDPLYYSGDDVLFGHRSYWFSPMVASYIGLGTAAMQEAAEAAASDPGSLAPPLPEP